MKCKSGINIKQLHIFLTWIKFTVNEISEKTKRFILLTLSGSNRVYLLSKEKNLKLTNSRNWYKFRSIIHTFPGFVNLILTKYYVSKEKTGKFLNSDEWEFTSFFPMLNLKQIVFLPQQEETNHNLIYSFECHADFFWRRPNGSSVGQTWWTVEI